MQLSNPSSQAILLPVRAGTILGSLAVALLLNFLPWHERRVWRPISSRWCSPSGACASRGWWAWASAGCWAC